MDLEKENLGVIAASSSEEKQMVLDLVVRLQKNHILAAERSMLKNAVNNSVASKEIINAPINAVTFECIKNLLTEVMSKKSLAFIDTFKNTLEYSDLSSMSFVTNREYEQIDMIHFFIVNASAELLNDIKDIVNEGIYK